MILRLIEAELLDHLQKQKQCLEQMRKIKQLKRERKEWVDEGIALCEISMEAVSYYKSMEKRNTEILQAIQSLK